MDLLETMLRTFEGESSKRLLWLPPLTLGYIFHLTGEFYEFVLAGAAVVGTRYFMDLIEHVEEEGLNLEDVDFDFLVNYTSKMSRTVIRINLIIVVTFSISAIYSFAKLTDVFTHEDIGLVLLYGLYLSAFLIVMTNWFKSRYA